MPEKRITIDIDEDGKISAKTAGFTGEACLDALMELLDKDEVPMIIKPTDDYYQQRKVSAKETIKQGGRV